MPTHTDNLLGFPIGELDRLAPRRGDEPWFASQLADPTTRYIPVAGEDSLLQADGSALYFDSAAIETLRRFIHCEVLLGEYHQHVYFALGLTADAPLPAGVQHSNLRPQFGILDDGTLALLGYARVMARWHGLNRFCGKCGGAMRSQRAGYERQCTRCGNLVYPRVNPAIIVLITQGERCLLGRQPSWAAHHYSTIAGFVEPGEDVESALRREVLEETNIRVGALHYQRSQPWLYPASLMLGYRAQAENTEIRCNDGELADARWFSRDELIRGLRDGELGLSAPQTIAHALIRDWFDEAPGFSLAEAIAAAKPRRTSRI